jgi:YD repeat-containing protein
MTHTLLRAGMLSCALLASTALTGPAFAQSAPRAVDENGVDLVSGDLVMSETDVHVGPASGGLRLERVVTPDLSRIGHNWDIRMGGYSETGEMTVQANGLKKIFHPGTGSEFVDPEQTGESLSTGVFTENGEAYDGLFTDRNGGRVYFRRLPQQGDYFAQRIAYPNGYETRLHWQVAFFCSPEQRDEWGHVIQEESCLHDGRVQSVTDNKGYQLKFAYAHNVADPSGRNHIDNYEQWYTLTAVTGINNAVEACNPTADTCTLQQAWPTATYARSRANDAEILEVNQPAGRRWRYMVPTTQFVSVPGGVQYIDDFLIMTPETNNYDYRLRRTSGAGYETSARIDVTVLGQNDQYLFRFGVPGSNSTTVERTDATGGVTQFEIVRFPSRYVLGQPVSWFERVRTVADPVGNVTQNEFDLSNGRLIEQILPDQRRIIYGYDARGNVTSVTRRARPDRPADDIVTYAGFSPDCSQAATCNQPRWTRDARGHQTDFSYDEATGALAAITLPADSHGARPQVRHGYITRQARYLDGSGALVAGGPIQLLDRTSACSAGSACAGSASESLVTLDYGPTAGPNNLQLAARTAVAQDGTASATESFTYDLVGNVVTIDGPLAGPADTARIRYDAARRVVGTVSPDPDGNGALLPRAARNSYLGRRLERAETGTVADQSDAAWNAMNVLDEVRFVYDGHGNRIRTIGSSGGTIHSVLQYSYDADNRLECTALRMNPAAFGNLPPRACDQGPEGSFGPDRITQNVRDLAGRVREAWSAVGTPLAAPEIRTTYTAGGQVESLTDGEYNQTFFTYDGHGRLRRTQYPVSQRGAGSSNPDHYDERTYDAAGNITEFRNRSAQVTSFTYDALNRLTAIDRPAGWSELDTTYGYDLLGRMTRATTFYSLTFGYDALGRQVTQSSPHGTIVSEYDLAGRRTRLTWPAAPGAGSEPPFFVAYDYLVTGEMTRIRENGATSGIGVLATFGYDDLGRRTTLTRGNGIVTSYAYDPASRLRSLAHAFGNGNDVTLMMSHNPAGQIVSRSGAHHAYAFTSAVPGTRTDTHNGRNEIAAINGTIVAHDARGNLVNDGTRTFAYASDNRMVQAGGATLFYDPLDRLRFVQGGANVQLIYDTGSGSGAGGSELIAEHDYHGLALLRRYVHGPGTDEPLVWYEGSGTADRRWLVADERGRRAQLRRSRKRRAKWASTARRRPSAIWAWPSGEWM